LKPYLGTVGISNKKAFRKKGFFEGMNPTYFYPIVSLFLAILSFKFFEIAAEYSIQLAR